MGRAVEYWYLAAVNVAKISLQMFVGDLNNEPARHGGRGRRAADPRSPRHRRGPEVRSPAHERREGLCGTQEPML